jgi:hypothetical protein
MDIRHAVGVKVGLADAKLAALADYRTSPAFSERERAALDYAAEIIRRDEEVSDACFARLREPFSEADVVELTFIVGYQTFASTFAKALQLAPQGLAALSCWAGRRHPPRAHRRTRGRCLNTQGGNGSDAQTRSPVGRRAHHAPDVPGTRQRHGALLEARQAAGGVPPRARHHGRPPPEG